MDDTDARHRARRPDSAKFNAETVDNLLYLHAAKAGRFTAGPGAPTN